MAKKLMMFRVRFQARNKDNQVLGAGIRDKWAFSAENALNAVARKLAKEYSGFSAVKSQLGVERLYGAITETDLKASKVLMSPSDILDFIHALTTYETEE